MKQANTDAAGVTATNTAVASYREMLDFWATNAPDGTALVDERGLESHAELAGRVTGLALGLSRLGIRQGDVVAVWLPNMREWVETAFAAAALGAVALGMNTKLGAYDVEMLLRESAAKALVTRPGFMGIDFLGLLGDVDQSVLAGLAVVCTGEPDRSKVSAESPQASVFLAKGVRQLSYEDLVVGSVSETPDTNALCGSTRPDTPSARLLPAQVFTSSGSTGRVKLILHSQHGLLFHAHACAKMFGFDTDEAVILGSLPLCGVFGFNAMLAGLVVGRPVVLQPVFSATDTLRLIEQHQASHMAASDTMLRLIVDAIHEGEEHRYVSWREAAFGNFTAGNPQDIVDAGARLGKKFFQTYGSSEVLALMTYPAAGSGPERWVHGGGQPISEDIQVRVRTPGGQVAAAGEEGEILVKGSNVAVGILRGGVAVPVPTDDDGFFGTGDLGYLLAPRDIVFQSRLNDALRIGGFLVSPLEVEAFLVSLPQIDQAQYVAVEGNRGLVPVAFVTAADGAEPDEAAVLAACVGKIATFKTPKRAVFVDRFPMLSGANGDKVDKKVLRAMAAEALKSRRAYASEWLGGEE